MIGVDILFVGKTETIPWEAAKVTTHVTEGLKVAILDGGMSSGRPSIMMRVPLNGDNVAIVVEMSARHWNAINAAIMGRYPDLLVGD